MTRIISITLAVLAAIVGASAQANLASTPVFLNCPASAVNNVKTGTFSQQCGDYTVTVAPDDAQTKCGFGTPSQVSVQLITEGPGGCTLEATATKTVVQGDTYQLDWTQQGPGQYELSNSFVNIDGQRLSGQGVNNSNSVLATNFVPVNSNQLNVAIQLRQSADCITVPGGKQCPSSQLSINIFNLNISSTSTSPTSTSTSRTSTSAASTISTSTATTTSASASASASTSSSSSATASGSQSFTSSATSQSTSSTVTATPTATPSSRSQKKRLQEEVQLRLDAEQGQHCPVDTEKCPVVGWADSWECIDTSNELSSCGGCASTGAGVDCEAIAGIAKHGSQCVAGKCAVSACAAGFKVTGAGSLCVAE